MSLRFEGEFAAAFRDGRSDLVLPGETLKTLVHAAARKAGDSEIEALGLILCERILSKTPRITRARVEIAEESWTRLQARGKAQGQAFMAGGSAHNNAVITSNGGQTAVVAGFDRLLLMRTAGFAPSPRDDDDDGVSDRLQRLLVGSMDARWTYTSADVTFRPYREGVRAAIIETFACHASASVQHTLYAIADVILATYEEIADVTLAFHEHPYRPADLFSAGIENPDELFVALEEPLSVVEVTVERDESR